MDIDSDEEERQEFSGDEDNELQNQKNEPWQCGLPNLAKRVLAIYENGNFSDITLTFPETTITYDAHRLILAISSPVFEGILFGPMRTESRNILIHDDDPLIMKYVIAHCYGEDLEPPDMNTALETYKLADKYILDSLKQYCCKHIVDRMNSKNNKCVIEFSEKFNFTDLKSKCLPLIKEKFEKALKTYEIDPSIYERKPYMTNAFDMLLDLSGPWIDGLLSEVRVNILDFHESWEYPESPLDDNRLRTILSSTGCYLNKFYGCINAESIQQFSLTQIPEHNSRGLFHISSVNEPLELNLSVTDTHHAKRVIEAINQQVRFESNLIALHIRCEEVWPKNWSPIPPEHIHRPSLLLISNADDDKTSWVVEAAKAFLPQCEGSNTKVFRNDKELPKVNILFLPNSYFTTNGFINLLQELSISGVKCTGIFFESPNISYSHQMRINDSIHTFKHRGFNPRVFRNNGSVDMFRHSLRFFLIHQMGINDSDSDF